MAQRPSKVDEFFTRIDRLRPSLEKLGTVKIEDQVPIPGDKLPLYSISLGSQNPAHPAIVFVGAVHGLELIGAQVALSFLETLCSLSTWDETLHEQLRGVKVLFYPSVNPGGLALQTRSNPRGVDLMRNSPIEGEDVSPYFLPGGHRISPKLPWFRGHEGEPMELENRTLLRVIQEQIWDVPFSLIIDFHSGFGMKDRLWFPYAYTKKPFPRLAEIYKLKELFDQSYPYNIHSFEPQALQYRTHGDVWDYIFLKHMQERPQNVMIPLCLELGSWIWVKKNPSQLFNAFGFFNPIVPHREQRTLRRHAFLLDFFLRAALSSQKWSRLQENERQHLDRQAMKLWYGKES